MSINLSIPASSELATRMTFEDEIASELRSSNPPSAEYIATLYLMLDVKFMIQMLQVPRVSQQTYSYQGNSDNIASISHNCQHPLSSRVKSVFDYANSLRTKNGLAADPWPIRITPPPAWRTRRRLVWSLNDKEIIAAKNLFERFSSEGLIAHSVDSDGGIGPTMDDFDSSVEEVIFRGV